MAFQSPAAGYAEQRIRFSELVRLPPHSSYVLRSEGDYPETGIVSGSLLAVDRSLTPAHGHIVIAELDNELVIRRLLLTPAPGLQELGGDGTVTQLTPGEPLPVWGVVAYALTDLAGRGFSQAPD